MVSKSTMVWWVFDKISRFQGPTWRSHEVYHCWRRPPLQLYPRLHPDLSGLNYRSRIQPHRELLHRYRDGESWCDMRDRGFAHDRRRDPTGWLGGRKLQGHGQTQPQRRNRHGRGNHCQGVFQPGEPSYLKKNWPLNSVEDRFRVNNFLSYCRLK